MDWQSVVPNLFPNMSLPLYVAHDGTHKRTNFPGIIWQSSDFDFVKKLRPAFVSAVEQEILIHAETFIASTHSSWNEYVIYKRALTKSDGQENYMIWKENLKYFTSQW